MNQSPRGVQTPPRPRPPQKAPASRPPQSPFSSVSMGFWVTLAVTMLLLASMLVTMTVMLCVADEPSAPVDEPSGGGQTQNNDKTDDKTPTPTTPTKFSKTGIKLPSVTKTGTYAYATNTAVDMSTYSKLDSPAAALIDVTNGKAVATKNGNERIFPASMTKVMTVLLACEKATDPLALLTVTEEMVSKYKDCDKASVARWWQAGEQVTVEDALYMAIYKSDTYACWLLAEHIAGSEERFAQMMTARARELGCSSNTNFINSTGLEDDNHYTTCFDMATIMAAAMNNTAANKVLTSKSQYTADIYINGTKSSSEPMQSGWFTGRLETYPYQNSNGRVSAAQYAGEGSDIELIAGKTGSEDTAGFCFVTAGKHTETGTLFVCVQVGARAIGNKKGAYVSTDDTREIYQRYATY